MNKNEEVYIVKDHDWNYYSNLKIEISKGTFIRTQECCSLIEVNGYENFFYTKSVFKTLAEANKYRQSVYTKTISSLFKEKMRLEKSIKFYAGLIS